MSVAAERVAPIDRPAAHQWWRNRFILVGVVAAALVIVFQSWRYQWPSALEWKSLNGDLDNFQTWLSDQQSSAHPNVVFSVLNGISTGLDDLVSWLATMFHDLTWAGTTALGVLVTLRFGGLRAGLWVLDNDVQTVAGRISLSPIKEQLVAALDDWAWHSGECRDGRIVWQRDWLLAWTWWFDLSKSSRLAVFVRLTM